MQSRAPLAPTVLTALRTMSAREPCYLIARRLGLATATIQRALAGLSLQRGTQLRLETQLLAAKPPNQPLFSAA